MKGKIVADLENLSDEEFMEAWTEASEDLEEAREKVRAFAEEQKHRDAQQRFDQLTDEDKKLLAQYVSAEGIASEENVNG